MEEVAARSDESGSLTETEEGSGHNISAMRLER